MLYYPSLFALRLGRRATHAKNY